MRGQRSAKPDGRHGRIQQRKKSMRAYISYFRLMAHGRVYETSLGGNGKFLRGSFKCCLFYAAGGNASPFLVKTRKLTDVGEAHLRSHRGNGKLAAFQQGVRFR